MNDRLAERLISWCRPRGAPEHMDASDVDFDRLTALIRVHRVGPWLHERIMRNEMTATPVLSDFLREESLACRMQCELDRRVKREAMQALVSAGIDVIPLKGATLGPWLYGKEYLRPSHDVDLLVPPPTVERASAVLRQLGFRMVLREKSPWLAAMSHERAFWRGDDLPIELHRHITQPERFAVPIADFWRRAVPWSWEGLELHRLTAEDQLVHLVIHAAHHKFLIPLIHWLDMALLLQKGLDVSVAARRVYAYGAGKAWSVAAFKVETFFGLRAMTAHARSSGKAGRAALRPLYTEGLAETDTRGPVDRWYGLWLIQGWPRRFAFSASYAARWLLDRPFVSERQISRQLRSKWGWRSIRLALFKRFSAASEGFKGTPHASQ